MEKIWFQVKDALKNKLPGHCFRMWIDPLKYLDCKDDTWIISCPNLFSKKRIIEKYLKSIEDALVTIAGAGCQLNFTIASQSRKAKQQEMTEAQLIIPTLKTQTCYGRLLQKDFTFDQFVVGGNNNFAYSAAMSFAEQKTSTQNTLLLFSKTGLGKSHLSQAIGHQILSSSPNERVYYITAEDFTNEMVDSFKNNNVGEFKNKYRKNCDVLLIEDLHYLSGKNRTQEELAQTIDFLFNAGKKVIFSSCYLPTDIPKLNDSLRSRLSGSIISHIDAPDYKTRIKILEKKSRNYGIMIPQPVLQYLASELISDIRLLESGLIGVATRASLMGTSVDLRLAEDVVNTIAMHKKNITVEGIKQIVCKHYNVSPQDIISKSRKVALVRPRQVAMYLARKYTDQPLQEIGKSFNRYHATALHSIGAVEKKIKENSTIQKHIEYLSQKIESGNY